MKLVEVPEPGEPHAHVFAGSVPTATRDEFREMINAQLQRDGLRAPSQLTWVSACVFCEAIQLRFGYPGEDGCFELVVTRRA